MLGAVDKLTALLGPARVLTGTDVSGNQSLGNAGAGIRIVGGTNNEIGGTTASANNFVVE